jgi:hypothetical protein
VGGDQSRRLRVCNRDYDRDRVNFQQQAVYGPKQKSSVIVFPPMHRKGDNVSWAGE